jgi:hypothetical protein
MTVVCFKQATALGFGLERTERRWVVVTLGILRYAQNDGKNLQQQNNGRNRSSSKDDDIKTTTYGWDERVHPTHR